jgi:hypothetical protein
LAVCMVEIGHARVDAGNARTERKTLARFPQRGEVLRVTGLANPVQPPGFR